MCSPVNIHVYLMVLPMKQKSAAEKSEAVAEMRPAVHMTVHVSTYEENALVVMTTSHKEPSSRGPYDQMQTTFELVLICKC